MSQGTVARKRYKGTDHRCPLPGRDCTTGHQNKRPASRKLTCSAACHHGDCKASWNATGKCHPMTVVVPASQHNTRLGERPGDFGSESSDGSVTVPKRIRGAPTAINRRCFSMWIVSN